MSGPNEVRQVGSFMISLLLACYNNIILLSAGFDGWEGGCQDGKLAGEEEQQQLEIGGRWFRQGRMGRCDEDVGLAPKGGRNMMHTHPCP
jgi:hypothetical protein